MKKAIGLIFPLGLALMAAVMLVTTACNSRLPEQTTPPTVEGSRPTPAADRNRVELALDKYAMDKTAAAACVYDPELNADVSASGLGEDANAHALARLCGQRQMNPVSAFWLLTEEALYGYTRDTGGSLDVSGFAMPEQTAKEYPFTAGGVRELLTELLELSDAAEDGLGLEDAFLGEDRQIAPEQIFYEEGDCYYAYFVLSGERSAHFLCFYLRGGDVIDDVEFQLLNLRYAAGDEKALKEIDLRGERQAASLMAAAELLLTGGSRADQGSVPFAYTGEGFGAAIERYDVTGYDEAGSLTNYAIHIEG